MAGEQHGRSEFARQSQLPLPEGGEHARDPGRVDTGPVYGLQNHASAHSLGRLLDGGADDVIEREPRRGYALRAACRKPR